MVLSVRKWAQRFKFAALFVLCTYVLYRLLTAFHSWIEPGDDRYRTPTGKAVKVFQQEALAEKTFTMRERLRRFYWYGGE